MADSAAKQAESDGLVAVAEPPVLQPREADPDDQERALAHTIALAIPALSFAGAVGTGVLTSAGPAILVLAGGALLGTITLLWASLRTLGGDAPLPTDLEALAGRSMAPSDLVSRKGTILRALKDLEHEREIGKLDDADFEEVAARYREEAKGILRALDGEIAPKLAKAEALAFEHLKKKGLVEGVPAGNPEPEPVEAPSGSRRVECAKCETSNEPDAAFCKKCGGSLAPEENHAAS
jgi:LSD1 subclass zinc finger protein